MYSVSVQSVSGLILNILAIQGWYPSLAPIMMTKYTSLPNRRWARLNQLSKSTQIAIFACIQCQLTHHDAQTYIPAQQVMSWAKSVVKIHKNCYFSMYSMSVCSVGRWILNILALQGWYSSPAPLTMPKHTSPPNRWWARPNQLTKSAKITILACIQCQFAQSVDWFWPSKVDIHPLQAWQFINKLFGHIFTLNSNFQNLSVKNSLHFSPNFHLETWNIPLSQ